MSHKDKLFITKKKNCSVLNELKSLCVDRFVNVSFYVSFELIFVTQLSLKINLGEGPSTAEDLIAALTISLLFMQINLN